MPPVWLTRPMANLQQIVRTFITPCKSGYRVRHEKAVFHSGSQTRPGTGSLHPVAIEAAAEATKLLKPSV
jgi:hypothetical protein